MIVIVCLDDNNGMLFNRRRLSRDITVIERIKEISAGSKLYINSYSIPLFEATANVMVEENFLDIAEKGDYCFVENCEIKDYTEKTEKIIVYRWNRKYPSDKKLDSDLSVWQKTSTFDFAGNSHDKITEEVYIK